MGFSDWIDRCGAAGKCSIGAAVVVISFIAGRQLGRASDAGATLAPAEASAARSRPVHERSVATPVSGLWPFREQNPFAVPRLALKDMYFVRFDEKMRVSDEARAILQISDAQAERLQQVALEFLPRYRASQARRIGPGVPIGKHATFEVAPARDEEAAGLRREFADAVAAVVGAEKACQLPFPLKINTGDVFQVFVVLKASEPGAVWIEIVEGKREDDMGGGVVPNREIGEIRLKPGEPMPEQWRHLLALEDLGQGDEGGQR